MPHQAPGRVFQHGVAPDHEVHWIPGLSMILQDSPGRWRFRDRREFHPGKQPRNSKLKGNHHPAYNHPSIRLGRLENRPLARATSPPVGRVLYQAVQEPRQVALRVLRVALGQDQRLHRPRVDPAPGGVAGVGIVPSRGAWPSVVARPTTHASCPQIRTCAINAYRSSSHGFAPRR